MHFDGFEWRQKRGGNLEIIDGNQMMIRGTHSGDNVGGYIEHEIHQRYQGFKNL